MTFPRQKAKPNAHHLNMLWISVKKELQEKQTIYQDCETFDSFTKEMLYAMFESVKLISKHHKNFEKYEQTRGMLDGFSAAIDETIVKLDLTNRSEDELFGMQIKIS